MSTPPDPAVRFLPSRQFPAWMAEYRVGVAITTYQAGKLFFLGVLPDGRLSVFERTFNRCMGLWADGQTLWLSTLYQLWRFENAVPPGQQSAGFDRLYVPRVAYTTGDIDIHDVAVDESGRVVFAATLFNCLATVSDRDSFAPLWKPWFVSRLAAEDRCHLNGLAVRDGSPRYVTCVSDSDAVDGWRDRRVDGGRVLDVQANEVVAGGLAMPHSPRWYDGRLWLLQAGAGQFGSVDPATGAFTPVAFLPGFLRGLAFVEHFAVIGLSGCRDNRTFQGLPLDDSLRDKNVDAWCGLGVVDLRTGDVVHTLRIEGVVRELYDVAVLPGVSRPAALGFKTDEIRRVISVGEWASLR